MFNNTRKGLAALTRLLCVHTEKMVHANKDRNSKMLWPLPEEEERPLKRNTSFGDSCLKEHLPALWREFLTHFVKYSGQEVKENLTDGTQPNIQFLFYVV